MANNYTETAAAFSINISRQNENQTNRTLLTNFNTDDVPPTVSNFNIEGENPSSVYNGVMWYNSNTQALYIQNTSRTPAGGYPYNNFTRIGIGPRIIHSEARAQDAANIARIEIGELVITVNSTDSVYGDTVFLKTGASTLTDIRSLNPSRQSFINKSQYPAYSFTGDTDTGVASNGTNEVGIVTNGNTIVNINTVSMFTPGAAANLGLSAQRWGTLWAASANLSSNLQVMGSGLFNVGSLTVPSVAFISDTNTGFYRPASDNLAFVAGGIEGLRVGTSGNVGIKTATPLEALHVTGLIRYGSNVVGNNSVGNRYVSTDTPTALDGADGDLWFKV